MFHCHLTGVRNYYNLFLKKTFSVILVCNDATVLAVTVKDKYFQHINNPSSNYTEHYSKR